LLWGYKKKQTLAFDGPTANLALGGGGQATNNQINID